MLSAVVVLKMAHYIVPRQEVPTEIRRIEGGRIAVKAYLFVGIELLDVLSLFAHAIKEIAYDVILFCHRVHKNCEGLIKREQSFKYIKLQREWRIAYYTIVMLLRLVC